VAQRSLRESRVFARAVEADAEAFEPLHETPGGEWAVYRLRWDRSGTAPAGQDDP
jgi:hypothetical protein